MSEHLELIAEILGWVFCIAWSVSQFPQMLTNFRRKSVSGYSIEFLVLNIIGYAFYIIFVFAGSHFQNIWHLSRSILIQDKIFAATSGSVVFFMGFQAFVLYRHTRTGKFSSINLFFAIALFLLAVYNLLLSIGGFLPWFSHSESPYTYSFLHYLGFGKSFCSLIKYIPQALLNYQRKSTAGYNVMGAMFDLIGGSCSLIQMVLKCYIHKLPSGHPDWSYVTGNVPKLVLAAESILFDLIFLTQHFILYRGNQQMKESYDDMGINLLADESLHNLN